MLPGSPGEASPTLSLPSWWLHCICTNYYRIKDIQAIWVYLAKRQKATISHQGILRAKELVCYMENTAWSYSHYRCGFLLLCFSTGAPSTWLPGKGMTSKWWRKRRHKRWAEDLVNKQWVPSQVSRDNCDVISMRRFVLFRGMRGCTTQHNTNCIIHLKCRIQTNWNCSTMGNARLIRFWFVLHTIKFYPISSIALKIVVAANLFSTFIPNESILLWQEFEYNKNVEGHVRRYIRTYSPSAYKLYKLHEYYELCMCCMCMSGKNCMWCMSHAKTCDL